MELEQRLEQLAAALKRLDYPHSSDCSMWADEHCDCVFGEYEDE